MRFSPFCSSHIMLYYTIGREKKQAEDHSLSAFDLSQLIVFPAKRRVALVPAELHLFTLRDHLSIQYPCNDLPKTVISREYSAEWKPGDEPYYPVNDEKNGKLYAEYKKLADAEQNVIFGGRLGEYKYYDMDAVIASALAMAKKELG